MPHLEQPRTPLTPEEVELAFEYLLAIQAHSEHSLATVIDRTIAVPAPTYLLLRLAEDNILPVTDLAPDADPCADSFALDEVGCLLLAALEEWTRECCPVSLSVRHHGPLTCIPQIERDPEGTHCLVRSEAFGHDFPNQCGSWEWLRPLRSSCL
ncbi:hypothetical protein ABT255_40130 [Streptomyces mirabilis]|uniref:hypothetical protein n=1 Tax=Streptomyces mirabilis TaxID=68239 RepID=UPI0033227D22